MTEEMVAEAPDEVVADPQDTRRWVQIGFSENPIGSWHLIDAESLGNPALVKTQCGLETISQNFLDRLPGGENDNELIDADCAKILGVEGPSETDEEETEAPAPKKGAAKNK